MDFSCQLGIELLTLKLVNRNRFEVAMECQFQQSAGSAEAADEEAVRIKRNLAEAHPAAFQSNFGGSLTALGHLYSKMGKQDNTQKVGKETVVIFHSLNNANSASPAKRFALSV